MIYFSWLHEEDEIIIRRDVEFVFALQYFAEAESLPRFTICFEDGAIEEQNDNTTGGRKKNVALETIIPRIDW